MSCLALLSLPLALTANAAEIRSIKIDRNGDRYTLVSITHFDATPRQVFQVLIDYDRLAAISETIKESRYLKSDDDNHSLVFTRIGACVLFYCKTIVKVERLETIEPRSIVTTAIPARSDVRYSRSEWKLEANNDGSTNVVYQLEFEPDFWVPPLIGPFLIKRKLIDFGDAAVDKIEAIAQEIDGSYRDDNAK